MSVDRFLVLVRQLLYGMAPPVGLTRVMLALQAVVEATGEPGAAALEAYCRERSRIDAVLRAEAAEAADNTLHNLCDRQSVSD